MKLSKLPVTIGTNDGLVTNNSNGNVTTDSSPSPGSIQMEQTVVQILHDDYLRLATLLEKYHHFTKRLVSTCVCARDRDESIAYGVQYNEMEREFQLCMSDISIRVDHQPILTQQDHQNQSQDYHVNHQTNNSIIIDKNNPHQLLRIQLTEQDDVTNNHHHHQREHSLQTNQHRIGFNNSTNSKII